MIRITVQFGDFKSVIVTRLAEHSILLSQQAAAVGTLIQDFEWGLFDSLLAVGGKKPRFIVEPLFEERRGKRRH